MGTIKNTKYLVAYNYGMGSVFFYVTAESFADIESNYPELELMDDKPFISDKIKQNAEKRIYSISEEPKGMLLGILENRKRCPKVT